MKIDKELEKVDGNRANVENSEGQGKEYSTDGSVENQNQNLVVGENVENMQIEEPIEYVIRTRSQK